MVVFFSRKEVFHTPVRHGPKGGVTTAYHRDRDDDLEIDSEVVDKQHYVLVKKGDDTYKVPYPFDCDRTVEALNRKNSEEEALTAAQRLFFWTEYKKTIKLD